MAPAARGRRPLRAVAGRRELRDGADRGVRGRDAGDRLRDRRLRRRRRRRRRRHPRAAGRPAAPRRGAAGALPGAESGAADGQGGPRERPALRMAERRRGRWSRSTRQALRAPEPGDRNGARSSASAASCAADGSRPAPAERLPSLDPAPARAAQRHGLARKVALGVAGVLGIGLTALAANKIGLQNVVASIVRSDLSLVLMALGLMIARDDASGGLVVRDRPRRASLQPASSPRRHLGDHDRSTHVGDAAGAARRARARNGARAAHRADAVRHSRCCSARSCRRRCFNIAPSSCWARSSSRPRISSTRRRPSSSSSAWRRW